MAFKILSFDEQELLTENQRKSYEEELAVYNERVRFVEQMERFENTAIAPYEPKLTAIPAVCGIPEQEGICFEEPAAAVVPKYAKISIPGNTFSKLEPSNLNLPNVVKPQNFEVLFIAPATIGSSAIMAKRPKEVVPAIKVPAFAAPEHTVSILPRPGVEIPEAGVFKLPGLTEPVLPRLGVEIPEAGVFKSPELTESALPKTGVEIPEAGVFNPPELPEPVLLRPGVEIPEAGVFKPPGLTGPVLPKTGVEIPEAGVFKLPELPVSMLSKSEVEIPEAGGFKLPGLPEPVLPKMDAAKQVPEAFGISMVKASFEEPGIRKAKLPAVSKAAIPTGEFTASEHMVSDLPMVGMPQASIPQFTALERSKPALLKVKKPDIILKQFKEVHSKASGLPTIHVDVPSDVCAEELLEIFLPLLFPLRKENGVRKESLHEEQ